MKDMIYIYISIYIYIYICDRYKRYVIQRTYYFILFYSYTLSIYKIEVIDLHGVEVDRYYLQIIKKCYQP